MNNDLINFLVGYVISINLIGIALMWLKVKTKIIKIKDKLLNLLFVLISILGGFIGVLVGNEMMGYATDSKIFKRWIPLLIFLEICIAGYIIYQTLGE